jgi:hypothetical protein
MGKNIKNMGGAVKLALTIVMIVCVAVFTILSDLIEPTINTAVYTSGYWLEILIIDGSAVAVIFLMKSVRVDNGKKTNKKYRILNGTLDVAAREINKSGAAEDLLRYINEDNKKAKRLAYETKLFQKKGKIIDKIQKVKAKYNNKRVLKGLDVIENPKTRKLIKLNSKLEFVEERVSKIDEEIPFVKVRYIKVTYKSLFGHGVDISKSDRDTSSHEALFNLFILLKKALLLVALGLFAMLSVKQVKFELSIMFFFMLALRIFQIFLAIYSGLESGDEFVNVNLCDAFMQRVFYLQGYFDKVKGIVKPTTVKEIDLKEITESVTAGVEDELFGLKKIEKQAEIKEEIKEE